MKGGVIMGCCSMEDCKKKVLDIDNKYSSYEILCEMKHILLGVIEKIGEEDSRVVELQEKVSEIEKWIDNFDTSFVIEEIEKYIATMIFVEISDSGYIIYNIPFNWGSITFNTVGEDIEINGVEDGTLVLSY